MLRRLIVGLVLGALIGGTVAGAFVGGLKINTFDGAAGAFEAYACALAVGVVAGLVTGKPIWASDAKVEAGLKAVFGALLAAGAMFALRRWAPLMSFPPPVGTGAPEPLGQLPASLALVGALLGGFFGVDNTDDGKPSAQAATRARISSRSSGASVTRSSGDAEELSGPDAASKQAKN